MPRDTSSLVAISTGGNAEAVSCIWLHETPSIFILADGQTPRLLVRPHVGGGSPVGVVQTAGEDLGEVRVAASSNGTRVVLLRSYRAETKFSHAVTPISGGS